MPGAAATSFSIAGMYLARALADEILLTNMATGLGVFALGATASVAQMTRRALRAARDPQRIGRHGRRDGVDRPRISLVSAAVFGASCALTGAGTGIALMGAGPTVASSAHCNTAAG